jgi:hypothetical protein
VIGVIAVFIQAVCALVPAAEVSVKVLLAVTAIVPVVDIDPQPPVNVTVYVRAAPATIGVPLIVTTFAAHDPDTPVGRFVTVAPVAPVVEYVIGVIAVFIQTVWLVVVAPDVLVTVLLAVTAMVPVVDIVPQPPVNVTV